MPHHRGSLFYKPKKQDRTKEIRKKRWNIPGIIWKAFKRTCMLLGFGVLISAILTIFALSQIGKKAAPALPKDMVLVLKLDEGIAEKSDSAGFTDFIPVQKPTIKQIIDVLHLAKKDARVKSVVVNLKGAGIDMAHIQEVRDAVKRFQKSGKKAYFYTSSFADAGGSMGAYYLAAAFDEIWLQPIGMLSMTGLNAEIPFAKDTLDKVGVKAEFLQREDYKNAMESFTSSEISEASMQNWTTILSSFSARFLTDISADRGIRSDFLKERINKGLMTGEEALKLGLIDRLDYADVLEGDLREAVTGDRENGDLNLVSFAQYATAPDGMKSQISHKYVSKFPKVALIYINGQIVPTAFGRGNFAAADDISIAIKEAADNEDIKVIVLRVDSPGGSPSASETIRRAIVKAKEKGKKIVVSMGNVAASGGYWVAADADFIFASNGTLTGSIGVLMGKFEASDLWEEIGVNWEQLKWGTNADLWSVNQPFTTANRVRLNTLIDHTYDAFLQRVAEGRKMDVEDVRQLAQGRIWTGNLAAHRGLVDGLGGLWDALDYAAGEVEVAGPEELDIVVLPRPKSPIEQFFEMLEMQGGMVEIMATLRPVVNALAPVLNSVNAPSNLSVYDPSLETMRN